MRHQLFQNLRRSTELRRRRLFDFTEGGQDPICETMFEVALFAILFRFLATERDDRVVDDLLFRSHMRDKRGLDLCQKGSARACSVTVRQLLEQSSRFFVLLLEHVQYVSIVGESRRWRLSDF